jgi:hypothetical protein
MDNKEWDDFAESEWAFDEWWDVGLVSDDNPFVEGTPSYWAWEGWQAGRVFERNKTKEK